jgi:hypothetical protein
MVIQIKKGRDGPSTLTCVRADGSRTWSKLHPFFPVHDLTHCAVESVLGFRQAFFGLIAAGRDIGGTERALPAEALWAENIVGLLDRERGAGERCTAETFNAWLGEALAKQGQPPCRLLADAELDGIRTLRDALTAQWRAVPPGGTLDVPFPASPTRATSASPTRAG